MMISWNFWTEQIQWKKKKKNTLMGLICNMVPVKLKAGAESHRHSCHRANISIFCSDEYPVIKHSPCHPSECLGREAKKTRKKNKGQILVQLKAPDGKQKSTLLDSGLSAYLSVYIVHNMAIKTRIL